MSANGSTTRKSMTGRSFGSMMATSRPPPMNRAASDAGRTVADNPTRCAGAGVSKSSRSKLSARCAPRFEPAKACTSSRITVSTVDRMLRTFDVSSRKSDSGVVTRISGGCVAIDRRSFGVVSPLRMATRISGGVTPSLRHSSAIPASGALRLRATSTASALSGEI